MKYISIEEISAIHFELVRKLGGSQGIRDFGLLHSAAERPKATFGGLDLYPDIHSKAAALFNSLLLNHPFIDGNKRTAYTSTARFFKVNGYTFIVKKNLIIEFILKVEKEKLSIPDIAYWLKKYTKGV